MGQLAQFIDADGIIGIVQRTFSRVDPRMMDHGARVAFLLSQVLGEDACSPAEWRNICLLAILHDIGAYKTEEIDQMVRFETGSVWEHSIYGYLFLKYFSPFHPLPEVILYHHADWSLLRDAQVNDKVKALSQLIRLADRIDIAFESGEMNRQQLADYFRERAGTEYRADLVEHFLASGYRSADEDPKGYACFFDKIKVIPFTAEEADAFMRMTIYAIDFRSRYTVTHTIATTSISRELAVLLELPNVDEIVCGAMLHDLGKVGIPVEILEYPGKLSLQAMRVMRSHVDITEEILAGGVNPAIRRLACRHHEKLDGSGYPRGLRAPDLTKAERVIAVADIISALSDARSYKEAFSREKTQGILTQLRDHGQLDEEVVDTFIDNADAIMERVRGRCDPVYDLYARVQAEYEELLIQYGTPAVLTGI